MNTAPLNLTKTHVRAFWQRVSPGAPDACWEWQGNRCPSGYGRLGFWLATPVSKTTPRLAHRIAWEIHNGPIPPGMHVCHHCDNPPCCNPAHLYLGTNVENHRDKALRGRAAPKHCELNGSHKVSADQVRRIRALHAGGMTYYRIAPLFGISEVQVSKIVRRIAWSKLP